jgi:hypothetical protein
MDIKHICENMVRAYHQSRDTEDYISKILLTISSGGSSSFTNKIGTDGMIINETGVCDSSVHLFARVMALCKYIQELVQTNKHQISPMFKLPIKVFRAVNLPAGFLNDTFIQPVPFSTTWNRNFAIDWLTDDDGCCIFEITVNYDTFLPLSLPNEVDSPLKQYALNQTQEEVVLPPSVLSKTGEYTITRDERQIRVIECVANRTPPLEMIRYYPEHARPILREAVTSGKLDGWINQKLLEYYNSEYGCDLHDEEAEPEWM